MALFKISKGTDNKRLTDPTNANFQTPVEGHCYYDTTNHVFYIDTATPSSDVILTTTNLDNYRQDMRALYAARALTDAGGNIITDTYATKDDCDTKVSYADLNSTRTGVPDSTNLTHIIDYDTGIKYDIPQGTVTSVAVQMNGDTKGTITSSGTIDLGIVLNGFAYENDVIVSDVTYHTYWPITPTSSNKVYGVAFHPTNGTMYRVYNNKGTYSVTAMYADGDKYVRIYQTATNIEVPLIAASTGTTTSAWAAPGTGYQKSAYGVIVSDTTKQATVNPSTGVVTIPILKINNSANITGVDATPTASSNNVVTSGGIYTAIATKQDTISDLSDIRSGAALGATAYQLPSGGITASDLASSVTAKLHTTSVNPDGAIEEIDGKPIAAQYDDYNNVIRTTYQTMAIDDSGNYFTTDTVEAALQQLGASVSTNTAARHSHSNKSILDATTVAFTGHQDISGKENKNELTISNTTYTTSKHTITIGMSDGTSTTINFVGVT